MADKKARTLRENLARGRRKAAERLRDEAKGKVKVPKAERSVAERFDLPGISAPSRAVRKAISAISGRSSSKAVAGKKGSDKGKPRFSRKKERENQNPDFDGGPSKIPKVKAKKSVPRPTRKPKAAKRAAKRKERSGFKGPNIPFVSEEFNKTIQESKAEFDKRQRRLGVTPL